MDELDRAFAVGLIVIPINPLVLEDYAENIKQGIYPDTVQYCIIRKVQSFPPHFAFSEGPPFYASVQWKPNNNTFTLTVGESHPGPGDNDFIAPFETFDEVIDAAINLYFGQPTIIDPWIVPLHQHPELDEAQVRHAIVQARTVTPQEFTLRQQNYQQNARQQFPNDRWQRALNGSFLRLVHTSDPQQACMLLRNAQVAIIIQS